MEKNFTVRMMDAAKITGRTRDSLRNIINLDQAPWSDEDFGAAKQRRFDGSHILALTVMEILQAQGIPAGKSGAHTRINRHLIEGFLSTLETGPTDKYKVLAVFFEGKTDDLSGFGWNESYLIGTGTIKEAVEEFEACLLRIGSSSSRGLGDAKVTTRVVCGPQVAAVNLPEAYRMAKERAALAGFVLNGFDIIRPALERDDDGADE